MAAEKDDRVQVGVRLPAPLARRLKVEAAKRDTSIQDLVEQAVQLFLGKGR